MCLNFATKKILRVAIGINFQTKCLRHLCTLSMDRCDSQDYVCGLFRQMQEGHGRAIFCKYFGTNDETEGMMMRNTLIC